MPSIVQRARPAVYYLTIICRMYLDLNNVTVQQSKNKPEQIRCTLSRPLYSVVTLINNSSTDMLTDVSYMNWFSSPFLITSLTILQHKYFHNLPKWLHYRQVSPKLFCNKFQIQVKSKNLRMQFICLRILGDMAPSMGSNRRGLLTSFKYFHNSS